MTITTEEAELHRHQIEEVRLLSLAAERDALRAKNARLREAALDALAGLVAAHSLLERGGKKAAPSNKMFEQMLCDYGAAITRTRAALGEKE
jgi:hypothetical protein